MTLSADGYQLSIAPMNHVQKQKVVNLHWNGSNLTFTLQYGEEEFQYSLTLDAGGNTMTGTATLSDGEAKKILWRRISWPPKNQLAPQVQFTPNQWQGDWEEDFGASTAHDHYRISLEGSGAGINVRPLNRVARQEILVGQWNGATLNFEASYNERLLYYELVPLDPNTLDGVATAMGGEAKHVRWRRIVMGNPSLAAAWAGVWKEKLTGRDTAAGLWRIDATGAALTIHVLTGSTTSKIDNITFDGVHLYFTVQTGSTVVDYALTMANNTIAGAAFFEENGRSVQTTWTRSELPSAAAWPGTWQEHWPNSSSDDFYSVAVVNGQVTVSPLTNVERQKLSDMRLDGCTLHFQLHYEQVVYEYSLTLSDSATAVGSATEMGGGSSRAISWEKMKTPTRADFVGTWEEQARGSSPKDKFLIRIEGDKLAVRPLTNLHKNKVSDVNVSWADFTLTFTLTFDDKVTKYRLTLVDQKRIIGSAADERGETRRLIWNNTSHDAPQFNARSWTGLWAEQWPNSPTTGVFAITMRRAQVRIKPKNSVQVISLVKYENDMLRFHLNAGALSYDYYLMLLSNDIISVTAVNAANNEVQNIQWNRMQSE